MINLKNKKVVITGATGGIGNSIIEKFHSEGAKVLGTGTNEDKLSKLKNNFNGMILKKFDISKHDEIEKFVDDVCNELNGCPEILINNAGITKDNLLMRMSEEDFDQVLEVNLKSIFNMTKAVQKIMLKQRKGSIINMSSVVGVKGNAGQSNYAASKAGVNGFTKSIALELASRNIRCNAIAPGFIETEMTEKLPEETIKQWRNGIPLKRGGKVEDVANLCLFLASDSSSYITGQVINVCGGMLT